MTTIENLSLPLRQILSSELAVGNAVTEIIVAPGWPPGCELFITLENKFSRHYATSPEVRFQLVDDCHYWFAEYAFQDGLQLLICGFKEPI
ncbi:hypothetical protein SAMN02745146_1798 [Hymenobacter daecheongensis DSM 21074]|uniref:Uncharacterized protein n=1 Tax=Hymenobacter daecheongensis DSM 21074 TaxID=1121955 RepID=A0A1M6ESM9_9BACT|nr:hypothetical protein SAMN02745146_1798 [Hymenobacter daecheongensis DSM 21074]